jgi:hypothetical protein
MKEHSCCYYQCAEDGAEPVRNIKVQSYLPSGLLRRMPSRLATFAT